LQRLGFCLRAQNISRPGPRLSTDVLVVEDDAVLCHLIPAYLARIGFVSRLASTGAQVVAALRVALPHFVLMDVGLPDANGFEIVRRMRAHPDLRHVPVMMLSGHAARADVVEGLASGADGYITKPFIPEVLEAAVKELVTRCYGPDRA
jgi:DNA-binding response OmpR family regulator